jgi:hypothetical protein
MKARRGQRLSRERHGSLLKVGTGPAGLYLPDHLLDLAKRQMLMAFGSRPVTVRTRNARTVFVRSVIKTRRCWGNHFQHKHAYMRSYPAE